MQKLLKGMFFQEIVDQVRAKKGDEAVLLLEKEFGKSCHFSGFKDYPIEDHMKLLKIGAEIIFGQTNQQSYFNMGKLSWKTFAKSAVGKTTMALYAHTFKKAAASVAKLWGVITNFGVRKYSDLGDNQFMLMVKEDPRPAKYIEGVIVGAAEHFSITPNIKTNILGIEHYEFVVTWEEKNQ